jgi:ATP-binding protein involved in chromosome partitioning
LATELTITLLGQVPIDSRICSGGDNGEPIVIADPSAKASQVFSQIAIALQTTFSDEIA